MYFDLFLVFHCGCITLWVMKTWRRQKYVGYGVFKDICFSKPQILSLQPQCQVSVLCQTSEQQHKKCCCPFPQMCVVCSSFTVKLTWTRGWNRLFVLPLLNPLPNTSHHHPQQMCSQLTRLQPAISAKTATMKRVEILGFAADHIHCYFHSALIQQETEKCK